MFYLCDACEWERCGDMRPNLAFDECYCAMRDCARPMKKVACPSGGDSRELCPDFSAKAIL